MKPTNQINKCKTSAPPNPVVEKIITNLILWLQLVCRVTFEDLEPDFSCSAEVNWEPGSQICLPRNFATKQETEWEGEGTEAEFSFWGWTYLYLRSVVLHLAAYHLDAELMSVLSKSLFTHLQSFADYKILVVFLCWKNACPTAGCIAPGDVLMGMPQCSISQCPCCKAWNSGWQMSAAECLAFYFFPLLVLHHSIFLVAKCCRDSFFN